MHYGRNTSRYNGGGEMLKKLIDNRDDIEIYYYAPGKFELIAHSRYAKAAIELSSKEEQAKFVELVKNRNEEEK